MEQLWWDVCGVCFTIFNFLRKKSFAAQHFFFMSSWKTQITYCFFLFSKSDRSQNVLGKYRSVLLYFLEKDFHWKKTGHSENCPSLLFLDMRIFWTSSDKMNIELQLAKAEEIYLWIKVIYLSTGKTVVSWLRRVKLHHLFTFILHLQRHKYIPPGI